MVTYYTSDNHFGHKNIIKTCNRPFKDVAEMNKVMIQRWNEIVCPEDTIYHLGDFVCFDKNPDEYFYDLNGKKILIIGNHDQKPTRDLDWAEQHKYLETPDAILFHYGMRVWNGSFKGRIALYGHSHSSLPGNSQSCDVGVDCWNFYPVTIEQIKERLKTLKPFSETFEMRQE